MKGAISYLYNIIMKLNTSSGFLKSEAAFALVSAVMLFTFLAIYRSFGIDAQLSASGHGLFIRSLTYATCFGFTLYLCALIIGNRQIWLLRMSQFILSLIITFLLLNFFWLGQDWQWSSFGSLAGDLVLFWVFPLLYNLALRRFSERSITVGLKADVEQAELRLSDDTGRKELILKADELLFATAEGNYLDIHFWRNGQAEKLLLRQSLKNLEAQYPNHLIRIHRKHLVALNSISEVFWHSRDAKVRLKDGRELKLGSTYQAQLKDRWSRV